MVSGRVKVSTFSADGQEVRRTAAPATSWASWRRSTAAHLATVTVVDPGEAMVVTAPRFLAALEEQPGLALVLLRSIVGRLRDADRKRAEFTELDVVGRVAHRLVEMAERYGESGGEGIRIGLAISQRELAGWVGSSREAVNKALQQLERQGFIALERRQITVLDLDAIRNRAS
jgi:CRP-like cAMP-binding protein